MADMLMVDTGNATHRPRSYVVTYGSQYANTTRTRTTYFTDGRERSVRHSSQLRREININTLHRVSL